VLRDGDNRLVLDLKDAIGKRNLAQALSNRPNLTLEELFPTTEQMCVTRNGLPLAHEIVVPFIANVAADATARRAVRAGAGSLRPEPPVDTQPRRAVHLPGSEWLCAHLYGSPRDADAHLADSIARLTDELVSGGLVDRWFFIRYADPEHHLRVRWHRTPEELSGQARPIVEAAIARAYEEGRLSRVSFDSYAPELDRYGGADAMPSIEELFWHDSVAVSTLLHDPSTRAPARRWQWTLLGMDRMLADLGFGLAEKAAVARRVRAGFAAEFRTDKRTEQQLSTHFRSHRPHLEQLVAGVPADGTERRALEVFDLRTANAMETAVDLVRREALGVLTTPLEAIAESLLHMHANRMLTTSARSQELVLYDHLDRIYRSALARSSVGSS
jgi:thiopeptide-type bacteriocin biosynthesis protein